MPVDLLLRWWDLSIDAGDLIALLIGAPSGSVSMFPNLTVASAVLLSSVELTPPRNKIILIEGKFPSVRYLYDSLATRLRARIDAVPSAAFDEICETGSWRRWRQLPSLVT